MKKLLIGLILLAATVQAGGTAFYLREEPCEGTHRACVYDYYGQDYYVMVQCYKLCPMSVEVPD